MISKKMAKSLNKQINAEMYSAYLYLSMSSQASHDGLPGVANWFYCQAKEEMSHAEKIYNYVNSQGERVVLAAIDQPPTEFESATAMFEAALEHEKKVTGMINNLANQAVTEKDHATGIFLQWFVTEQVEEEEHANDILSKLKLVGPKGNGLFMIDRELGSRTFTPPAAEEEA